ncbi:RNA polymerase sigma-70 factor (ECF subfamily) [Arcticibacter tournemirensis]|uniref:Sigma-70 family RNA polymerase sigma factor n=1 Tax=Arcticibacter tournemirensis TaxID=699437 RepID=A0A5M9GV11_9SPHI|nr:sigma-70 family RNA polymerase sigma factor [Arcticibacter tournemirensis]KAA8476598.1 sigma-70 family RNA polymerase sigma factor [Arcticibacter tournemirensis]TQM52504.1 RNA polymerase sigma-70 factor (ECF subfamily) [Arcticibacter tournemirensis]
MRHKDEFGLLKRVSTGDPDAFRILYEHYSPSVYSFIRKYLRSSELSDDICQNVFVKIWEQREQMSSVLDFSAWVFTIAKRQSLDFLKRAATEQSAMNIILQNYPSDNDRLDSAYQLEEYMNFIEKVLLRMPPQTQHVFNLCRQQSKSYEEAASELGVTRNAIKKHMVRSMKILKEAAENELGISFTLLLILLSSQL